MNTIKTFSFVLACSALASCGKSNKPPKLPPLPERSPEWVQSIRLDSDSVTMHIGKTRELVITQATTTTELASPGSISVGDTIDGVTIGAIKCVFFQTDEFHGNKQFMWRGRWRCQAGRSEHEVQNAIRDDGTKVFDYIYIAPVNRN